MTSDLLIVTTPQLEGRPIRHYLGLVHGETILGANLFRDLLASIRDLVGGRARAYETTLQRAREMALAEMARRALGQAGGMLMACATGTAVTLETAPTLPLPAPAAAGVL